MIKALKEALASQVQLPGWIMFLCLSFDAAETINSAAVDKNKASNNALSALFYQMHDGFI